MSAHSPAPRLVTLCGGVGAARLLAGAAFGPCPAEDVVGIVNVGDDEEFFGLHVSPDLDTIMYTTSGRNNTETGWGLAGETWRAIEAVRAHAAANKQGDLGWFGLGDVDLGTHLYRTARLAAGAPLSAVTNELCRSFDAPVRLRPATDDPLRTEVHVVGGGWLAFQEYFVRERHSVAIGAIRVVGAESAAPAPDVVEWVSGAEVVVIAPSNPIVSIGPIRAVPTIESALAARRDYTVAISPLVSGAALKGPADRMMTELGYRSDAVGVAEVYRPIAGTIIIDEADAGLAGEIEALGVRVEVADTIMATPEVAGSLLHRAWKCRRPGGS